MSKTIIMVRGYTTKKQGEKLIKLGISPKTADMYYRTTINGIARTSDKPIIGSVITEWDIPCWSVGALLEVMPKWDDYSPYIGKNECFYSNGDNEIYHREVGTPIDAAFEMVCWLVKHGYIKN